MGPSWDERVSYGPIGRLSYPADETGPSAEASGLKFAADSVVAEGRGELIRDLVPLRRRLNLRRLPRHRAAASVKPVQKGGNEETSATMCTQLRRC